MPVTIDWGTRVINVDRAYMTLVQTVPYDVYELDLDVFRLTLRDLEDDLEGMPHPTTHDHVAPINAGGVLLARVVSFVNGYTVTFEDVYPTLYAVSVVGGNSNIADVLNLNCVSVRTANSAGLVETNLAEAILDEPDTIEPGVTMRQALRLILAATGGKVSGGATNTITFRNAVNDSLNRITATVDSDGNRTSIVYDTSDA